jgi:hypothetical protein
LIYCVKITKLVAALAAHVNSASRSCHQKVRIPSYRMKSIIRYLRYLGQSEQTDNVSCSEMRLKAPIGPLHILHAERTNHLPTTCGRYTMHVSHYRLRPATNVTLHDSKFCPVHHTWSSSNHKPPSAWAVEPVELPTANRDTITGGQHRTCGSSGSFSNPFVASDRKRPFS